MRQIFRVGHAPERAVAFYPASRAPSSLGTSIVICLHVITLSFSHKNRTLKAYLKSLCFPLRNLSNPLTSSSEPSYVFQYVVTEGKEDV